MEDSIEVISPSGTTFRVQNDDEVAFLERTINQYYADNLIVNISDKQDLDRIMLLELMMYRWGNWLTTECDYEGNPVNADNYRKTMADYSSEARQLKKALGIDRKTREGDGGTVADYIENLKLRAEEFGIMRNEQAAKAIELFSELSAFVTLMNNTTPDEQYENKCGPEDLIKWIEETAIPEYKEIDAKFRETSQKYWIGEI